MSKASVTMCPRCGSAGSVARDSQRCEVCGYASADTDPEPRMMQIGEVAAHAGLSLRTVRYYEEVGLVEPSGRTDGGFRLYTDHDLARLLVVKRMKPLDLTLDELREMLEIRDALESQGVPEGDRERLRERLAIFAERAADRCTALRARLEAAEALVEDLRRTARPAPRKGRRRSRPAG